MSDARAAFLCKLAASIPHTDKSHTLLKSYYLMRCRGLSNNMGMFQKDFPPEASCSHCGIKWTKGLYVTNIQPRKITKTQKRKIKNLKETSKNQKYFKRKNEQLLSNRLERICQLCSESTFINLVKPDVAKHSKREIKNNMETEKILNTTKIVNSEKNNSNTTNESKKKVNVYSLSKEIFSLHNKNNSIVMEKPKAIKNNKRKKDKFAGLCKAAVLASAKLKQDNESTMINKKLNLFLKPSS